jgi:hypothetical protein
MVLRDDDNGELPYENDSRSLSAVGDSVTLHADNSFQDLLELTRAVQAVRDDDGRSSKAAVIDMGNKIELPDAMRSGAPHDVLRDILRPRSGGPGRRPASRAGMKLKASPKGEMLTLPPRCTNAKAIQVRTKKAAAQPTLAGWVRPESRAGEDQQLAPLAAPQEVRMPAPAKKAQSPTEEFIDGIEEMIQWTRPWERDHGFSSTLMKLTVQMEALQRGWVVDHTPSAARPSTLSTGQASPDPIRTAQSCRMFSQLLSAMPECSLKSLLVPFSQELFHSIYENWPWNKDHADLPDSFWDRLTPFLSLVGGCRHHMNRYAEQAAAANTEAQEKVDEANKCRAETKQFKSEVAELKEQLAVSKHVQAECEKKAAKAESDMAQLKRQSKFALAGFAETQSELQLLKIDREQLDYRLEAKEREVGMLREQFESSLTKIAELSAHLDRATKAAKQNDGAVQELAKVQDELNDLVAGRSDLDLKMAARISKEVLGEAVDITKCERKTVINHVHRQLRDLATRVAVLQQEAKLHSEEVMRYQQLIPVWNVDAFEDLYDAFHADAAVHRAIFSMKDCRNFAGLGTGENVPKYLRTDGMVKHVFISKAEIETFMTELWQHLEEKERALEGKKDEPPIDTLKFHEELHRYLKGKYPVHERLLEFAYAFMCSLEVYRSDPDFELFDLVLCGKVHPSIQRDQRDVLKSFENLLLSCETAMADEMDNRPANLRSKTTRKVQVNRRLVRAALDVIFPDKTPEGQNGLRSALYTTLQAIDQAPSPECCYVQDLFAETKDGSQTPFVEEIRRQHFYEICGFTNRLTSAIQSKQDSDRQISAKSLETMLEEQDPHMPGVQQAAWTKIAMGSEASDAIQEITQAMTRLRHGVLLRPTRLWVRAQVKDVVKKYMMAEGPQMASEEELRSSPGLQPRQQRTRGLKVIDNPMRKVQSADMPHAHLQDEM